MPTPKRPNQILFYPTDAVQAKISSLDKGDRSGFINKAVEEYSEKLAGDKFYALERAYEALKFMLTPEAEAVRTALREILWRRGDTPDAVIARLHLEDGSFVVDQFADFEKAIMIALARPNTAKLEIYDKSKKLIGVGSRTANDTFSWNCASPPLTDKFPG